MKKFDVIIGGAGFAGIYAAWRLAKSGCSVALLEAENGIGGNLNSRQWGKFWLDNGTHNFDMRTKLGNDFFQDIMGDDLQIWTEPYWASTMNKSWSHGFEMPDLQILQMREEDQKIICDHDTFDAELEEIRERLRLSNKDLD